MVEVEVNKMWITYQTKETFMNIFHGVLDNIDIFCKKYDCVEKRL